MTGSPFDLFSDSCTRRRIRISKVLVHENFTDSENDIALLRLGIRNLSIDPLHTQSQKIEWTSQSSVLPVYLMEVKAISARKVTSMVSGSTFERFITCLQSGWGDTGTQDTSTDKLQEAVVPIVDSSNCVERMNQNLGVDKTLIVCAATSVKGPCKVSTITKK